MSSFSRQLPFYHILSWWKYQCTSKMQDWQVNIIKHSVFWQFMQFCSSWAVFHSIVRGHCKENMVWIRSAANWISSAANFGGKRWIHNEFGWFLQLLFFWSSSVALFWPFFGDSKYPKYQNINHAIINHCWARISVQ